MYRIPSRRTKKHELARPNLIPILDGVFIFIFFLLMSASFIKIFEVPSDVPIISDSPPPKNDKPPLGLTIRVQESSIEVLTGIPGKIIKRIGKVNSKNYDLASLHDFLVKIKSKNINEYTAILEPEIDIDYQQIIDIMDSVRMLKNTDEALYRKDKDGQEVRIKDLFSNLLFGNIQS